MTYCNSSGIYKILNKTTGKFYIGSSVNIGKRWSQHRHHLRHNKHNSSYLQNAWNLYGENDFEFVIIELVDINNLIVKEQEWLNKTACYTREVGYNLTSTAGARFRLGVKLPENIKQKLDRTGCKLTEAHKQKIGKSLIGNTRTLGFKQSEETKEKKRIASTGKTHTPETREKLRQLNLGRKASEETRKKLSLLHKGHKEGFQRKYSDEQIKELVLKHNSGKIKSELCKEYSITPSTMTYLIKKYSSQFLQT